MSWFYWHKIKLSDSDKQKFEDFTKLLNGPAMEQIVMDALTSDDYSFNLKKKILFDFPENAEAAIPLWDGPSNWGCRNLQGADLQELLMEVQQVSEANIDSLRANPHFLRSRDTAYDAYSFFMEMDVRPFPEPSEGQLKNKFIRDLINDGSMTLDIAGELLVNAWVPSIAVPNVPWVLDEQPIIVWAREQCNLPDIPDSFVRKYVTSIREVGQNARLQDNGVQHVN